MVGFGRESQEHSITTTCLFKFTTPVDPPTVTNTQLFVELVKCQYFNGYNVKELATEIWMAVYNSLSSMRNTKMILVKGLRETTK